MLKAMLLGKPTAPAFKFNNAAVMKGELLGLLVIKKPTTDYVGLCTQAIHHPTRTSGSVDAISEIGYIGDLCFSWLKW